MCVYILYVYICVCCMCVCVRVYVQMYISILGCMYIVYVYASSPKTGLACLHFLGWGGMEWGLQVCVLLHLHTYMMLHNGRPLLYLHTYFMLNHGNGVFLHGNHGKDAEEDVKKKNCDCCPSCRLLLTYMVCCIDAVAWSGNVTVRYRTMAIEAKKYVGVWSSIS